MRKSTLAKKWLMEYNVRKVSPVYDLFKGKIARRPKDYRLKLEEKAQGKCDFAQLGFKFRENNES